MVLVVIFLGVAAILGAIAAFWAPPAPPRVHLLSLAFTFLCLALLTERWPGG